MLRGVYQGKKIRSEGSGVLCGRLCSFSFHHLSQSWMLCFERKMLLIEVGEAAWNENDFGSDSRSNTEFRRCPCKARQGHCHHLLALAYTVLNSMKKSDGASACTSKPQQRHVSRGAKIDPQVRRIIPMTSSELWWSVPTQHAKGLLFH